LRIADCGLTSAFDVRRSMFDVQLAA